MQPARLGQSPSRRSLPSCQPNIFFTKLFLTAFTLRNQSTKVRCISLVFAMFASMYTTRISCVCVENFSAYLLQCQRIVTEKGHNKSQRLIPKNVVCVWKLRNLNWLHRPFKVILTVANLIFTSRQTSLPYVTSVSRCTEISKHILIQHYLSINTTRLAVSFSMLQYGSQQINPLK